MPRDYKQRPARPRSAPRPVRRNAGGARWPWFGAGVCVGALATAALFVYEPGTATEQPAAGAAPAAGEPRAPRFEFYTLLPEKEIAIPDPPPPAPAAAGEPPREPPAPKVDDGGRYLLQVGSFRSLEDADRLKAKLAFLGLASTIQTVSIDGTETWHRVRVGPYAGRAALDEARARLEENQFDALVLKLK